MADTRNITRHPTCEGLPVYPNWDDPLLPLMAAYHAAVIRSDGLQTKLRDALGDEELAGRSLYAAEAVIEARAALYRGLMDRGWTPPSVVTEALRTDLAVLHLPGV